MPAIETLKEPVNEIKAINFAAITDYYKNGYVIFYQDNQLNCCVIEEDTISYVQKQYTNKMKFYLINKKDLLLILESSFSELNTKKTQDYLSKFFTKYSAKMVDYKKMITGFVILFLFTLFFFPNIFFTLNNIVYLLQNFLKAILFKRSISIDLKKDTSFSVKIDKEDVPIYTVFVPLYKEVRKLKSIIKAMDNLDYPKSKLDVKFIIEEDDKETNKALSILDLPEYIHVIKVPKSFPRTKPKAMNYATIYIKGKYLCIYDAEDKPDSDQLLKALQAFKKLPEEYACVQARLNFYNSNENILTKFFSIEYSLWFKYLLKGLNLYDLPITLGGTSNHFKVSVLSKIGYWDAYNVTEDADLGIRLYSNGYKVHILDSDTLEESPINIPNWLAQRTRWIKGFIQTIYVFSLSPKNYKKLGFVRIAVIYVFVGFSSYSFFCTPWLILIFLFRLNEYIYHLWIVNTIFSLIYVYFSAYYITKQQKFTVTKTLILLVWPFYFLLHSIAAYLAIIEAFTQPFKWNKTKHGVSSNELD